MNRITNLKYLRSLAKSYSIASSCCHFSSVQFNKKFNLSNPVFDEKYLLNEANITKISENIQLRKGVGDIKLVHELNNKLKNENLESEERIIIENSLQEELRKIPNETHPEAVKLGETPKAIAYYNEKPEFKHEPFEFSEICKKLNLLRNDHLGNFSGHKSYFLMSDLAEMEQTLIRYTLSEITRRGFQLISVPDILPAKLIQSCGMATEGERNQVYKLLPSNLCLSGTSEMALAGYFSGTNIKSSDKPLKVASVSRCFRAETSGLQEEKGIYRVHQFTKVEMFSVCHALQSSTVLDEFKEIEISLFKNIGLHFQLLDMPPCELGAPAFRKYDIEAWMAGRKIWGEISSCSNCTDYQARRLNITTDDESNRFAHTVNGTACAVPRMLIAIIETFQKEDGTVTIPKVLQPFMKKEKIFKRKLLPELKLIKSVNKS